MTIFFNDRDIRTRDFLRAVMRSEKNSIEGFKSLGIFLMHRATLSSKVTRPEEILQLLAFLRSTGNEPPPSLTRPTLDPNKPDLPELVGAIAFFIANAHLPAAISTSSMLVGLSAANLLASTYKELGMPEPADTELHAAAAMGYDAFWGGLDNWLHDRLEAPPTTH